MQYLYGGGVMKYWVQKMGYDPKTDEINKWNKKYGDHWDAIWDRYIFEKLQSIQGTIIDTKVLGFFVEKPERLIEIFLVASKEARQSRAGSDKRKEDLAKRDRQLKESWKDKYGVNIFDKNQIRNNYDLLLNTSEIGIRDVAYELIKYIYQFYLKQENLARLESKLDKIVFEYNKDSDYLVKTLKNSQLYIEPKEIFAEMRTQYEHLFENLPEEMKFTT